MAEGARPTQVTLAGWAIMIGSVLVVITGYDTIAGLTSIDTRESVEELLADSPSSFGVSVNQMLEVMRWSTMVAAAAAAASVVLGWQTMQHRSKGARIALSVLAVPLFVGGMSGGGFFVGFVAAGVMLLWMQPSRDWYDGVTRRSTPHPAVQGEGAPQQDPQPGQSPFDQAQPQPQPQTQPGPAPVPFGAPPRTSYPDQRPPAVKTAAVLTWGFSALSAVALAASAILVAFGNRSDLEAVIAEAEKSYPELYGNSEITSDAIVVVMVIMCLGLIAWAVAASVVAWLALRGVDWARILLIVSASCAGLFMALFTLTMPVMLIPVLACGATVWLLLRREVSAWFTEKRREALTRR